MDCDILHLPNVMILVLFYRGEDILSNKMIRIYLFE